MDAITWQTVGLVLLTLAGAVKVYLDARAKRKAIEVAAKIIDETTAQGVLIQQSQANQAQTMTSLADARSRANFAVERAQKIDDDNTVLQLHVQALELGRIEDKKRITDLEDGKTAQASVITELKLQLADVTKISASQQTQIAEQAAQIARLTLELQHAATTIAALADANATLKEKKV